MELDFTKPPDIRYLKYLTTEDGLIQHTKYGIVERKEGYALDDNARALVVVDDFAKLFDGTEIIDLAKTYIAFIRQMQKDDGWFYTFLTYDLKISHEKTTQDSFGRTLWGLGHTIGAAINRNVTLSARDMFEAAIAKISSLEYSRAKGYSILGLYYSGHPKSKELIEKLSQELITLFEKNSEDNWVWFESFFTYDNAILPVALLFAYRILHDQKLLDCAIKTFHFLNSIAHVDGIPAPIGQKGWFYKGQERALYDQQPVDVGSMVFAASEFYQETKDELYKKLAQEWFSWYWGNNLLKKEMIDLATGGVFDGLHHDDVNLNQGAESIIAYLIAYMSLSKLELHSS